MADKGKYAVGRLTFFNLKGGGFGDHAPDDIEGEKG
jgi:hypothetical protein